MIQEGRNGITAWDRGFFEFISPCSAVRVGRRTDSPSVIANAWHHRSDALSSIGTMTGIGLAYFLGDKWRIADPLAALVVSVFIFKIAFDLLRSGLGRTARTCPSRRNRAGDTEHPDSLEGGDRTAPSAHTPYRSHRRHRSPYPRRSSDERAPLPSTDRRYRTPAQKSDSAPIRSFPFM